jgi:hypothetical protein
MRLKHFAVVLRFTSRYCSIPPFRQASFLRTPFDTRVAEECRALILRHHLINLVSISQGLRLFTENQVAYGQPRQPLRQTSLDIQLLPCDVTI